MSHSIQTKKTSGSRTSGLPKQQFAKDEHPHRLWELTVSCAATKLPRYHHRALSATKAALPLCFHSMQDTTYPGQALNLFFFFFQVGITQYGSTVHKAVFCQV